MGSKSSITNYSIAHYRWLLLPSIAYVSTTLPTNSCYPALFSASVFLLSVGISHSLILDAQLGSDSKCCYGKTHASNSLSLLPVFQ